MRSRDIFPITGIMIALVLMDIVWLTLRKQYHTSLFYSIQKSPLQINYVAAIFVYVLLGAAVFYVAVKDATNIQKAALYGGIVGFFMYGFYDATNMATLTNWTWTMVLTDTMWGTIVSAAAAALGYYFYTKN